MMTEQDEAVRQRLNDEYMRGYRAASRMLDSLIALERAALVEEQLHEPTGGHLNKCVCGDWHPMSFYIAAERRATVERIRERLFGDDVMDDDVWTMDDVRAILDEEAA